MKYSFSILGRLLPVILSMVTALTLLAALVFRGRTLKKHYRIIR